MCLFFCHAPGVEAYGDYGGWFDEGGDFFVEAGYAGRRGARDAAEDLFGGVCGAEDEAVRAGAVHEA